ncbi:bacterial membrane YfhO family protein [Clostridium baratii str. Sullivan]|uniref:Bacterial membrane YfhO family protein n=1 Tax=Clostridium baratii str. Sullivan TaxID=1415775 RepID=A0A0A7FUQ2_9CLOT|nr:YfhO family protein [Clostridium baratii]AIY82685.1 bacterial membrane YfhO family protein [Clostridium baratii str. Sullivan]
MKILERIKKSTVCIYTGLFLILISLFLALFFIKNKTLIWDYDGINQHFSILYNYNEVIRNFISNPSDGLPQWSWSIGYGSDLLGTYAYYVLGDLFDYISLLFPLDKLEIVYSLLIVIRLYVVGLAFILYSKKMKFSKNATILGSISYAFSGFIMMSAIKHPYFINPLIILPLAFVCIENVLKNRKKYLFSIIVAIAIISNFYFFYMIAIISVLYALLRYFEVNKTQKIKFGKYFIDLVIYFLIGVLIAGIVLLPTLYSIFTSSRISGDSAKPSMLLYSLQYYFNLVYSSISSGSYPMWSILTLPILTFMLLPIFLRNRKKYSTYFYMLIIFFVMLFFPIVGLAMNGLSSISNRWTLIFAFMSSVIICIGFDNIKKVSKKDILWMFSMLAFWGIFAFIKIGMPDISYNIFPSIFLGALIIGVILYNFKLDDFNDEKNNKKFFIVILVLLSVNIAFNNYYRYSEYGNNYIGEFVDRNKAFDYYKDAFDGAEQNIKNMDNSFYRIAKTDNVSRGTTRNNSLVLNYNGIDSFLSINNGYLAEFSRVLNNRSFTPNSPIINFDNRIIVSDIMGVKYYIGKKREDSNLGPYVKKVENVGDYAIYKNENALPFGYVYKNILNVNEFDKLNGLEKEQSLVYAASVSTDDAKSNVNTIPNKIKNITFDIGNSTAKVLENKIIVTKPNQKVILNISDKTIPEGSLYVNISGLKFDPVSQKEVINNKAKKINTTKIDREIYKIKNSILTGVDKGDGYKLTASYKDVKKSFNQPDSLDASMYFTMDATLINLGYYKEQANKGQKITLTFNKAGEYTFDSMNIFSLPIEEYNSEFNDLKDNSMKLDSVSNNKVTGTIDSKVNGVITFQIPYTKGWTLKIDGKETKTFPVNKAFLGANLDKGNHSIELTYKTPFLRIGMFCSFVGIILLIVISILNKKKFNKKIEE